MKKRNIRSTIKRVLGLSLALTLAVSSIPENAVFHWSSSVVKAADATKTIDSTAIVQQIDSKETNRPGIPDGTLLNELKRLVNTKLGRTASNDITFGELMAYDGEIDLSAIGSQITSIKGLGYARKASKIVLTNVVLTAIEDYEFDGCTGLQEIVLPNGLISIGKFAFRNCNQLSKIVLPDTTTSIGESAFDTCTSLSELNIPNAVSNIGKGAFGGCISLTEMTIPNGNVVLGASVFEGCRALQTVHLPEGITEIPVSFFASSGIKNIDVPTTVEEIKQSAFKETAALPTIDLSKCIKLKTLGSSAFALSGIQTIQLPSALRTIKSNAFDSSCIQEISIPDSVQGAGDGIAEGGVEQLAFWNCRYLKSVSLPAGISALQKGTFLGCWNLQTVEIRNAENSILGSIKEEAFSGCNHLDNTNFLKNLKNLKSIGDNAFQYEKITDETDAKVYQFYTRELCLLGKDVYGDDAYSAGLTSIILPDSVTELGKNVFTGQPNLKTVSLGNGLTVIPEESFKNCVSLETVKLPAYLKEIKANAFNGCIRLKSVEFPNTLETIGDSAFSDCGAVKTVNNVYYHVRYIDQTKVYSSRPAGNIEVVECLVYNCESNYNQSFHTVFLEKTAMLTEEQYQAQGSPAGYKKYIIVAEKRYAKEEKVYHDNSVTYTQYTNYTLDEQTGKITKIKTLYSDELGSDTAILAPKEGYTGYFVRQSLSNQMIPRDYYGMSAVTLPNSVKSIGKKAFYNCYNLQTITLSNQIAEIPESAFAVSNKKLLYKYDWIDKEQTPLQGMYMVNRSIVFPEKLDSIGNGAFQNNANLKLTNGVFPDSLKQIGDSAFEECHSIERVIIPSQTKTIGNRAFYGCSEYKEQNERFHGFIVYVMQEKMGLQEMDLTQASSLESIGKYAFSLTPITQCTLPQKVTSVSQGLFAECAFLKKVICSEATEAVKADVFSNCGSLVSITVPAKATISYNAFRGYQIGSFSFSITDPEPISVSIGEEEALPINTFLSDYLRDEIHISEKNGTTGFLQLAGGKIESLNDWNIYKAKVKGIAEGTTRLSVVGTNNYSLYGDIVISKAPEVSVTVNVTRKKCESIQDTTDKAVLSIEDKRSGIRLHPEVLPADCSESKVWFNENETIVNVVPDVYEEEGQKVTSSSALLVPNALGTSKVTLQVGSVKKEYQVNVVVPASSVTLSQSAVTLKEGSGETVKLEPVMTYDTTAYSTSEWNNYQDILSYSSDNSNVVSVSADGVMKAVGAGIANVTVTALGSKKTAVCEVRVLPDETMVYFTDEQGKALDTTKTLQVQAKDIISLHIATEPVDSLSELTYEFSGLSTNGIFSYLKNTTKLIETKDKGTQEKVISMEFNADKIGSGVITVLPKSYKNKNAVAASIKVEVIADTKEAVFSSMTGLEVGEKKSAFGYLVSSAGKAEKIEEVKNITTDQISFSSSDPTIASIDALTGELTGIKEGHVTLYMQIVNPYNAGKNMVKTMELDVTRPFATNVIVKEKDGKSVVKAGDTLQLETSLIPANAIDTVSFTSLTPNIATVDATGKITGIKAGTGIVEVITSGKAVSAKFEFTVTDAGKTTVTVSKVSGLKAVNAKGKKMKLAWKKVSGAKGYQIVYATNKTFSKGRKIVSITKNSTIRTIAKLKKGTTYYVKVRAYKKNGTQKVYGKYSAVKKVKIKK